MLHDELLVLCGRSSLVPLQTHTKEQTDEDPVLKKVYGRGQFSPTLLKLVLSSPSFCRALRLRRVFASPPAPSACSHCRHSVLVGELKLVKTYGSLLLESNFSPFEKNLLQATYLVSVSVHIFRRFFFVDLEKLDSEVAFEFTREAFPSSTEHNQNTSVKSTPPSCNPVVRRRGSRDAKQGQSGQ